MFTAIDPTSGKVLHEYPSLDKAGIEEKLQNARQSYETWKQKSFQERGDVLKAVAKVMRDDIEQLALLMTEEMGKPINEARGEVLKAAWCAEHYADHAEQYLATQTLASDATLSYVSYLPLGTVLGILPWNAPFWLAFRFCAPALMAGNTCVMKHDSHVPACADAIAAVFDKAGAPAHIMQNFPVETPDIADVINHPLVQAVSFTGSSGAGSKVAAQAGAAIKPVVLELGGSDPAIVLADADLNEAASTIALSRIINAGQSCIAAKRIIVEAPVYDEFIALLEKQLASLTMGDPREEGTQVGPIAREDLRTNLARQVEQTVAAGARLLLGGKVPEGDGYFYPVTLLADVTNDMVAGCEETFGPIATVMKAVDATHAIDIANDSQYGLAASIWTEKDRGEAMASKLEVGQVSINGIVKTDPRLPSGGVKKSGIGRELGPHGIMEFVNAQQVWIGPKQE